MSTSLKPVANPRWRFALPLGIMAAILWAGHRPVPVTLPSNGDKVAHLIAYGVLAAAWFFALVSYRSVPWRRASLSALFSSGWGLIDEVHQSFVPGRFASVSDLLADAAGALGCALMLAWATRREVNG